jgi:hypothetical protein
MKSLRQWALSPDSPYEIRLAADARLSQTDYTNDQSWDIQLGRGDAPAFALQTSYGGRVGLASIVPMWHVASGLVYQSQEYHGEATIRHFLPSYIVLDAMVQDDLHLTAEHFALDSQTVAGWYHVSNQGQADISLRCELFAHVGAQGQEQKISLVNLHEQLSLSLGTYHTLAPVIAIQGGTSTPVTPPMTPKIGINLTIPAGKTASFRWVHSGLESSEKSSAAAAAWLATDWTQYRHSIIAAGSEIPVIETGNDDWDLLLTSSYQRVVQALLSPALQFSGMTQVSGRLPELGFSRRADGSDHHRMWEGQDIQSAHLTLPLLATIQPLAAQQIILNYLSTQNEQGEIDLKPGVAGQRAELLCVPLLAQLSWRIFELSGDREFLQSSLEPLLRFVAAWLLHDADQDGIPEWQSDRQLGYPAFPTFAAGQTWAQGASPSTVESPDLVVWLLAELTALEQIATLLKAKNALKQIKQHQKTLQKALAELWNGQRFTYRDRDTHLNQQGTSLLRKGAGDQVHQIQHAFAQPQRLLIKITGGVSHVPNVTLHLKGLDAKGNPVHEQRSAKDFHWQSRQGICTSAATFSQLESISCEGLSRVYTIDLHTVDTTGYEITALVPLILEENSAAITQALTGAALNKQQFLRTNGITMIDASSSNFDPSSANGAGGLWMFWHSLLARALLRLGHGKPITSITRHQLEMLTNILKQQHEFSQFYHADEAIGLGERGHLNGIAPLDLLHDLWGIRVLNTGKVALRRDFWWDRTITIQQHGVKIKRTKKSVKIVFPSGHRVELKSIDQDMLIEDPQPMLVKKYASIQRPPLPDSTIPPAKNSGTVRIPVDIED